MVIVRTANSPSEQSGPLKNSIHPTKGDDFGQGMSGLHAPIPPRFAQPGLKGKGYAFRGRVDPCFRVSSGARNVRKHVKLVNSNAIWREGALETGGKP